MSSVNWDKFDSKYVKFENDVKKTLVLIGWRNGESKYEDDEPSKPALVFDVLSEDGKPCSKEFKASAFALIQKLKPIVMAADDAGRGEITVSITRVGKGASTNYVVEQLN